MSSGKFRVDTKQIQRILTETIITLCKSTLDYDMELSIKGILGITLDQEDILLVDIKEIIKGEQILCKKAIPDSSLFPFIPDKGWPTSTSTPLSYPLEPSPKRHRPDDSPALNLSQSDVNASSGTSTPVEKAPQPVAPPQSQAAPPRQTSGPSRSRRVKREPMKVIVIEDKDVVNLSNHGNTRDQSDERSPGSKVIPSTGYTILGVPTRLTSSTAAISGRGMTLPTRVLGTAYETPVTKSSPFPIAMGSGSKPKKMPALEVISPTVNSKDVTPPRKIAPKGSPNRSRGSSSKRDRPEKKHKCPNCCFSSDRRFNLERHMRQHTGGGVVCYHCGRSFCDDYYLKNNHLPKCPANPELDNTTTRKSSEPVDLSMSDVSHVGLNITPLQIVSVETMADKSGFESDGSDATSPENTESDAAERERNDQDRPSRRDSVQRSDRNESMETSPSRNLRKRKSSVPPKNISELLAKDDNPDAMNNNNSAAEALFDPSLKIKDEPIDT